MKKILLALIYLEVLQNGINIKKIKKQLKTMSQEMDELKAKVEANGTVIGSAITLLQNIKQLLDAAGTDPIALKQLSDDLGRQQQDLAEAVVANTPAADPIEPPIDPNA